MGGRVLENRFNRVRHKYVTVKFLPRFQGKQKDCRKITTEQYLLALI